MVLADIDVVAGELSGTAAGVTAAGGAWSAEQVAGTVCDSTDPLIPEVLYFTPGVGGFRLEAISSTGNVMFVETNTTSITSRGDCTGGEEATTTTTSTTTTTTRPPAVYAEPDRSTTVRYQDTDRSVTTPQGYWGTHAHTSASGGSYQSSGTSGHPLEFRVRVPADATARVTWIGIRSPNNSQSTTFKIKGTTVAMVSSYHSSTTTWQASIWTSAVLPAGDHVIELTSTSKNIYVDAFDVATP